MKAFGRPHICLNVDQLYTKSHITYCPQNLIFDPQTNDKSIELTCLIPNIGLFRD